MILAKNEKKKKLANGTSALQSLNHSYHLEVRLR